MAGIRRMKTTKTTLLISSKTFLLYRRAGNGTIKALNSESIQPVLRGDADFFNG